MVKSFKILSIDGGGIKGLYSAIVLEALEKKYGPITKYFDLICGTSTGGIIALGLAAGKPMAEIVSLYREHGATIFPQNKFKQAIRCLFKGKQYSRKALDEKLEKVFGPLLLDAAQCCLCIPALKDNHSDIQPTIFKTSHDTSLTRDRQITMLKVAQATSAAPTYFSKVTIDSIPGFLADGGLWMNNPCFAGATEAITYFVGHDKEYQDMKILSIGNIRDKISIKDTIPTWVYGGTVSSRMLEIQARAFEEIFNLFIRKKVFPVSSYLRVEKNFEEKEKRCKINLDDSSSKNLKKLESWAKKDAQTLLANSETDTFFLEETRKWIFPVK